jgi:pantothenate kinase
MKLPKIDFSVFDPKKFRRNIFQFFFENIPAEFFWKNKKTSKLIFEKNHVPTLVSYGSKIVRDKPLF